METNTNKQVQYIFNKKKYFTIEVILLILALIGLIVAIFTSNGAFNLLHKKQPGGVVVSLLILAIFMIFAISSISFSIISLIISSVGFVRSAKDKKQMVMMILSILMFIGSGFIILYTLVIRK